MGIRCTTVQRVMMMLMMMLHQVSTNNARLLIVYRTSKYTYSYAFAKLLPTIKLWRNISIRFTYVESFFPLKKSYKKEACMQVKVPYFDICSQS